MIKRELLLELKAHLAEKEMTFIVGPRQAGKTTLMMLLKDDVVRKGAKTVFLNLDIEADREHFLSQEHLLRKIRKDVGEKGYVFLDEIQRKENAGIFLKGIYDMNLKYKFIVSGSGSAELKENIRESLAGRKLIFELGTLSFREFANYRTNYQYENRLKDFFEIDKTQTRTLLEEYLNFGGYPKVVLQSNPEAKEKSMREIYQSYVERDIFNLLGIQKEEAFNNLLRILASQIGSLANISEISSTLGISRKTVERYLWYLEKTFVIEKVTPFYKNIRKELTKTPKFYFTDLGLRNYVFGEFGRAISLRDAGFLFENFVFLLLRWRKGLSNSRLHFWRTKDGAEVDFVFSKGRKDTPFEVKFIELKKEAVPRSFKNFISKYHPENAYVVNLSLNETIKLNGTKIHFLPFYKIFFQDL